MMSRAMEQAVQRIESGGSAVAALSRSDTGDSSVSSASDNSPRSAFEDREADTVQNGVVFVVCALWQDGAANFGPRSKRSRNTDAAGDEDDGSASSSSSSESDSDSDDALGRPTVAWARVALFDAQRGTGLDNSRSFLTARAASGRSVVLPVSELSGARCVLVSRRRSVDVVNGGSVEEQHLASVPAADAASDDAIVLMDEAVVVS